MPCALRCGRRASRSRSPSARRTSTHGCRATCRCWSTPGFCSPGRRTPRRVHPRRGPAPSELSVLGRCDEWTPDHGRLRPCPAAAPLYGTSARSIGNGWPDQARTDVHGSAGADQNGVGRRQAERQQADGAEVQAAGRDVGLADARLVAAEADAQPAVGVERPGRLDRAPDDRRQRAAHLRRRHARRAARRRSAICASSWKAPKR